MKRMIRNMLMMMFVVFLACGNALAADRPEWQTYYQYFIQSGEYAKVMSAPVNEYREMMRERDLQWDGFTVYDLNRDGIPELIVRADYAIEQADVFTWDNGSIRHLGTMGGDNFFQSIICYNDSRYPGLYTIMGGPVMNIDEYTMANGQLQHRFVATTSVDSEGEVTTAVNMHVSDDGLYQLLRGSLLSGPDRAETLVWTMASDLQSDAAWGIFFSALRRPGAFGY